MGERTNNGEADLKHAQRLLSVLLHIAGSRAGVTSVQLRETHYPKKAKATQIKYLRRDLEELRALGIVLTEVRAVGQPITYKLSAKTWADPQQGSDNVLAILDIQCRALLANDSFDNTSQLASALAKLRASVALKFDSGESIPGQSRSSNTFKLMEACALGRVCTVSYVKPTGEKSTRELEVYGHYRYGNHTYFVCGDHDHPLEEPHRFRDDRFDSVTQSFDTALNQHKEFTRPADFDINSYLLLPFQIGEKVGITTLRASNLTTERLKLLVGTCGTVNQDETEVSVWYADAAKAAAWAVANGLIPVSDDDVMASWTTIVNGVAS